MKAVVKWGFLGERFHSFLLPEGLKKIWDSALVNPNQ